MRKKILLINPATDAVAVDLERSGPFYICRSEKVIRFVIALQRTPDAWMDSGSAAGRIRKIPYR